MIKPTDFKYDTQTASDNKFEHNVKLPVEELRKQALQEFDGFVAKLREKGVKVIVLDKSRIPELAEIEMPDGVFPNWFTTEANGILMLYKMHTEVREHEKALIKYLEQAFYDEGYLVFGVVAIGSRFETKRCLEGTALVFDRLNKVIYSGISERDNPDYFDMVCKTLRYKGVSFDTAMSDGAEFYHTDLYLCIGEKFAVVCLDAIKGDKRKMLREELESYGKEIIEISLEQVENNFCGNVFEVKSKKDGKNYLVMSEKAHKGFKEEQLTKISKYAELIVVDIPIIENVGGGSARCMLTGCVLPEDSDKKPAEADVHPIKQV